MEERDIAVTLTGEEWFLILDAIEEASDVRLRRAHRFAGYAKWAAENHDGREQARRNAANRLEAESEMLREVCGKIDPQVEKQIR